MSDAFKTPVDLCVSLLRDAFDNMGTHVGVSSEMPKDRAQMQPYVQISRTGGTDGQFLMQPIMTLMCWAQSDESAYMLADSCYAMLSEASLDHDYLSACEMVSLGRDEWTGNGHARYMLQLKLTINR